MSLSGAQLKRVFTDSQGNFAFLDTTVGRSYNVSPAKSGFGFAPNIHNISLLSGNVALGFVGFPGIPIGGAGFLQFAAPTSVSVRPTAARRSQ